MSDDTPGICTTCGLYPPYSNCVQAGCPHSRKRGMIGAITDAEVIAALRAQNAELVAALVGEPDMPECINPLSWIAEAAKQLRRTGPDTGSDDPAAYWDMVNEVETFISRARAAFAAAGHKGERA